MKFYCDKCNAKYAISDDKVRGKILKVRCKKCSHIITVREPTAPVAAATPATPAAQKQIAWHYSINGQTFGPFTQSALVQMYTDGSVPEASYVWNESFDGWKPALEIEPFGSALRKRHQVRPPARTMGISGALQAISIDNHQPPEGEVSGVAPGQEAQPSDDLSGRLDALRGKLQAASPAKAKDNPFAKKTDNPFAAAESEPAQSEPEVVQEDVLPEQTEVDQPALSIPKLNAPPSLFDEPAQDLKTPEVEPTHSPEDSLSAPLTSDSLFDEPAQEAPVQDDPFALGAPTPEAKPEVGLSFGNDLGADEGAIDFSSINASSGMQEAKLVLGEEEKSDFVASHSLLIQLDEIKKQGRSKRIAFRAIGAIVLLCILGGGGFMWWQNRQVKQSVDTTLAKAEQDSHKGELVIPTYKKLELMTFGEEEVIKISDTKEDFEEEQKPDNTKTDTKTTNKTKPVMLAKNTKTRPKSIDSKPNKGSGLGINVNDLTRGSGSGLGNALNTSKTKKATAKGGLQTTKDGAKSSDAKIEPGKKKPGNLALSLMNAGRRTKNTQIYRPTAVNTKPTESNAPPSGTLTKAELKKGFVRIRKSVGSCYQRHVRRGLPFDSPKIKVNVEILNTGRVSRVFFNPSNLSNTEFGRCMNQRKQTWSFRAYTGGPLKVGHTYVLQ